MKTQEIRRQFLNYFKSKEHALIASSPVVPHDDPTLLFTNAGMNQFKDVFLGKSRRDYKRAATSQKCIRVGGKHNDLDNVGHTSRHLTFFEMVGNFSFGDYFKKEAIQYAWEVATEVFGFEPERIWPTVFESDEEAFELWTHYVPAQRICRFGEKDNFWAMGETGPCGPCSELLYDRGSHYGQATKPTEDVTGERFFECWNLVFMQFNRHADGSMEPLPRPSIDTGAGLERIISLCMSVETLFATDVLRGLIAQVENATGLSYDSSDPGRRAAFHVIADHVRCLSFAIADGAQPSNIERGYVLRKLLRRAVRYGKALGFEEPFLAKVLPRLVDMMGEDYPELAKAQGRIAEILTTEEEAFIRTLRRGGNILSQIIEHAQQQGKRISGDEAFKLKDTYGLPIEEVLLLAKDNALSVDMERYQQLEQESKERSRKVHKTTHQMVSENLFSQGKGKELSCQFIGYTQQSAVATVMALVVDDAFVEEIAEGQEGMVICDVTPFYAEMGGQIGDRGELQGNQQLFEVSDCQSPYKGIIAHIGKVAQGKIAVGDCLTASVDRERRQKIANNHTATHLLHWALHVVLGEHVKQAGSVVDGERLRFDFNHHKAVTPQEIRQIETLVNEKIRGNLAVRWYELPYDEAQKRSDIKQFFGEKYGSSVRVVDIDYSKELCGGTHVASLGSIGLFRIAKEGSIAAGVRRIEAVTGKEAELLMWQADDLLQQLSERLKIPTPKLTEKVDKLLDESKRLTQELKEAKKAQMAQHVSSLVFKVETVGTTPLLACQLQTSAEELRLYAEDLLLALKSALIVLASAVSEDKCAIVIRISDDLVTRGINAQAIAKMIAPIIEGSGGGKPNSAQMGGKAPHKIAEALAAIRKSL